jgi:hypothetical protein
MLKVRDASADIPLRYSLPARPQRAANTIDAGRIRGEAKR